MYIKRPLTLVLVLAICVFIVIFAFIIRPQITGAFAAGGKDWENRFEISVSSLEENVTVHIVFGQYKPINCSDGILVKTSSQVINYTILNSTYTNTTCNDTNIFFENIIYSPYNETSSSLNVNLNQPGNSATIQDNQNINFNFTATSSSNATFSCGLYLNSALNMTDESVANNTLTNFLVNGMAYGDYTWYVNCTDGTITNQSSTRTLNLTNTTPSQPAPPANIIYETNQTGNETNESSSPPQEEPTNESPLITGSATFDRITYYIYYGLIPANTSDTTPPEITDIDDDPDPFYPNGDGVEDSVTISFELSENASITIKVYNSSNALVRNLLENSSKRAGLNVVTWNGKDNSSIYVKPGVYTYNITAKDAANNTASAVGAVTAAAVGETLIPPALITPPNLTTITPATTVQPPLLQSTNLSVCGNGICEANESQATCCLDCSCELGKICENNTCTEGVTKTETSGFATGNSDMFLTPIFWIVAVVLIVVGAGVSYVFVNPAKENMPDTGKYLEGFITQHLRKGFSPEQIKQKLLHSGWSEPFIDSAFAFVFEDKLERYVRFCISQGLTAQQIKAYLGIYGWPEEQIEIVLRKIF